MHQFGPVPGLMVAVLQNRTGPDAPPEYLAKRIAFLEAGIAVPDLSAVKLDTKALDALTGVYRIDGKSLRTVTREGDKLFTQRTGGPKLEALASSPTEIFYKDSLTWAVFEKDAAGKVTGMTLHRLGEKDETAKRTDEPLPKQRAETKLDPSTYGRYAGRYELAPGFVLEIAREGDTLTAQATGQSKLEIFPESETEWFLKVVDAQITFVKDETGAFSKLILHQNGRDLPAPRMSASPAPVARGPRPPQAKDIAVYPAYWDTYVGTYQLAPTFSIAITVENGHLMAQATGQSKLEIFEKSETEFFYQVVDAQISFVKSSSGKVVRLVLHQNGRDMPGEKLK